MLHNHAGDTSIKACDLFKKTELVAEWPCRAVLGNCLLEIW